MPVLIERPATTAVGPSVARRDLVSALHLSVLSGLCALSLFAALGSTPLWEPDEPRFAGATRHMLRTGDFLDPVFNGRPRWEKPIFLYWLQAAPLALGMDDELAMRLPAAVLGMAAVIGVYVLGAFWWSRTAGLVSAALLATTFRSSPTRGKASRTFRRSPKSWRRFSRSRSTRQKTRRSGNVSPGGRAGSSLVSPR